MNKNYLIPKTYHVLIVDDEDAVRFLAAEALRCSGYQVTDFASGKDALNFINENKSKFDLILLDMMMPEMNGDEFFYKIKEIQPFLPVVIFSAMDQLEKKYECLLNQGLQLFLKKPITGLALVQNIKMILLDQQTISIESGLATLLNKEDLYLKILNIYHEEYANLSSQVNMLLEEEKFLDIEKWIHKIKGVSLNIGSQELYNKSTVLSKALKDNVATNEEIQRFILYHDFVIKDVERILEARYV